MSENLEMLKVYVRHIYVIPMPSNCPIDASFKHTTTMISCENASRDETVFRTYTNVLQINQELLIPTYTKLANVSSEQVKLKFVVSFLSDLISKHDFKAKRIVMVPNTDTLAEMQGNIHCMSNSLNSQSRLL